MAKSRSKQWKKQVVSILNKYIDETDQQPSAYNWRDQALALKNDLSKPVPLELDMLKAKVQSFLDNELGQGLWGKLKYPVTATLEYVGLKNPPRLKTKLQELLNKMPSDTINSEAAQQVVLEKSNAILNAAKQNAIADKPKVETQINPKVSYSAMARKGLAK